ncbi:MAG: hypothetical protein V4559_10745 [Pseudomonadota bacterium]
MTGVLEYLDGEGFDAGEEYARLLAKYDGTPRWRKVFGLLRHLLGARDKFEAHQKRVSEFRPYKSQKSGRIYSVYLAEPAPDDPEGPFFAYLALKTATGPLIYAIYCGDRNNRHSSVFYDEVWAEVVQRLALKGL